MEPTNLTDAEINRLAARVDRQMRTLISKESAYRGKGERGGEPRDRRSRAAKMSLPEKQKQVIETVLGESAESFWIKYKRAARKDLCHPDGLLNKQWKRLQKLRSKDVVKTSTGILAGMGISGNVPAAIVAASVILIYYVTHIGIEAICEDYE